MDYDEVHLFLMDTVATDFAFPFLFIAFMASNRGEAIKRFGSQSPGLGALILESYQKRNVRLRPADGDQLTSQTTTITHLDDISSATTLGGATSSFRRPHRHRRPILRRPPRLRSIDRDSVPPLI